MLDGWMVNYNYYYVTLVIGAVFMERWHLALPETFVRYADLVFNDVDFPPWFIQRS